MRKRLRKKLQVGEFQVLGFLVSVVMRGEVSDEQFDDWWGRFIQEAIEANGLICGGGGCPDCYVVFVHPVRGTATEGCRAKLRNWCLQDPLIDRFAIGELLDANSGDEPDEGQWITNTH